MTNQNKITLFLATFSLALALSLSPVQAKDNGDCQIVYGGQVCGSSTEQLPIADTAGSSQILYTLSAVLYTTGLTSFVLAKNTRHLLPKLS